MRGLILFFAFLMLLASPAVIETAIAQEGDGTDEFEEGGPPREPPFVDEEDSEDLGLESEKPSEKKEIEVEQKKVDASGIAEAPVVESKAKYSVPKQAITVEGRKSGSEKIYHPMAAKGLISIDKEGKYHYKTKEFKTQNIGILFNVGQVNPPPDITGVNGVTTYSSMYGGKPVQTSFAYEWYPFTNMGKLGLQGGFGFFSDQGKGRFDGCNTDDEICIADETYTFYGVPLSLGVVYRLQIGERPWFAPYIAGGGIEYLLMEKRDDSKPMGYTQTQAIYATAGVLLNVSSFDTQTAYNLESEYGIHNMWITGEYKLVKGLSKTYDMSANIYSLGLMLDY